MNYAHFLEVSIDSIREPLYFQSLVSDIMQALYGNNYQAIHPYKDRGADGIIVNEKTVIQAYCPTTPTGRESANVKSKIEDSILKTTRIKFRKCIVVTNFNPLFVVTEYLKNIRKIHRISIEFWGLQMIKRLLLKPECDEVRDAHFARFWSDMSDKWQVNSILAKKITSRFPDIELHRKGLSMHYGEEYTKAEELYLRAIEETATRPKSQRDSIRGNYYYDLSVNYNTMGVVI